MLDTALQYHVE